MANAKQKSLSYQKLWKLKDGVKLMSINMSKAYQRSHTLKGRGPRSELVPREIKVSTRNRITKVSFSNKNYYSRHEGPYTPDMVFNKTCN